MIVAFQQRYLNFSAAMDLAGDFSLSGSAAPKTNVRVKSAPSPSYKRGSGDDSNNDDQRQPTSMQRARSWNLEVENCYRIQVSHQQPLPKLILTVVFDQLPHCI